MSQLITPHLSFDQQTELERACRATDAMLGMRRLAPAEMRAALDGGRAADAADSPAAVHARGGANAAA
jgi:hypothetical protein